ncbi:hypothetical protein LJK88_19730 [Paenibacillus sp. P26]|nr:hypothetical protein LJK88_19730 [Paenibacillus sp. P26]
MEMSKELFQPSPKGDQSGEAIVRPSLNYWQDAWRRLKKNKLAMFGLIALIVLTRLRYSARFSRNMTMQRRYMKSRTSRRPRHIGSERTISDATCGCVSGGEREFRWRSV